MNSKTLSRKEFDILTYIEKTDKKLTQRKIASSIGLSVGSINTAIAQMHEKGYITTDGITEKGLAALEPYRVKRVIFIAAGFGSRLVPITLNTPKPLVRVKGVRMIDTLIDAVLEAGIEEIYIVRGYLGGQFNELLEKYPMIHLIDNPEYKEANNISSIMQVRHLLKNTYVMDADIVLYNKDIITKYQYSSNYLGVPVEKTDDWCLTTKNKVITGMALGGIDCHYMFGISYWNEEDGEKLFEDIKNVYDMPGGKERYWDEVALTYCKKNYHLEIRECSFEDIIEIDNFSDLQRIDEAYR